VTDAPAQAHQRRAKKAFTAANNGGYRHYMVSIQGMLNSQQKAKKHGS
jgi:hypothetical protein